MPRVSTSLPREFVVFDTETTGMPPGCRLLEIGALKVRGDRVVDSFQSLAFPETTIPPGVTAIHGIGDAMVADAPEVGDVLADFFRWAGPGTPLVGHNVAFDGRVLAAECVRLGLPIPEHPLHCTLRAARLLLKRPSHALEALVDDLGLPRGTHHRALEDARHAFDLLLRMTEVAGGAFRWSALGRGRPLTAHVPEPPSRARALRVLEEARDQGEAVVLRYRPNGSHPFECRVTPRFLYRRSRHEWLEALCHRDCLYKSYRLDRVAAARPEPGAPPVAVRRVRRRA